MGKLIQFPIARLRTRRAAAMSVFSAFGELESLERSQLKLVTFSCSVAVVVTLVLQLTLG